MSGRQSVAIIFGLLVIVAITIFVPLYVRNDSYIESHSLPVILNRVYKEVPLGASKAQVIAWSHANRFQTQPDGRNLDVIVDDTGWGGVCSSYYTTIKFSFDKAHKVSKREGSCFGDCL